MNIKSLYIFYYTHTFTCYLYLNISYHFLSPVFRVIFSSICTDKSFAKGEGNGLEYISIQNLKVNVCKII